MYYNNNVIYCLECGCNINNQTYNYSINKWGVPLCIEHQRWLEYMETKTTGFTIRLYFALKIRGIHGELEKFDGYKHIDIAIPRAKINIEVDGSHHNINPNQALSDLKRTYHSLLKGYYTIRIPNSLTYNFDLLDETADYLADLIHKFLQYNY